MLPTSLLRAADRAEAIVLESWNGWIETLRFAYEVQGVVSMRLARLAQGGPQAAVEARLMIAEKFAALADAEVAIAKALSDGEGFMVAAERAYAPVRRRVGANSLRLARAMA
jgi:ABC-type hemin transport system ATPase subunit